MSEHVRISADGPGDDADVEAGRCCPHCRHDLTEHNRAVWGAGYSVGQRHEREQRAGSDREAPTLTDFLVARYAEEEVSAQAVLDTGIWEGSVRARGLRKRQAEIQANYRILRLSDDYEEPCPSIRRALALPYADHADYRQEWKP